MSKDFYDNKGMKSGSWTHHNQKLGVHLKATFANNLMHGECIYFDDKNFIVARGLVNNGKVMQNGLYLAFYHNGNLRVKGMNKLGITFILNPFNHIIRQGFACRGH